jgi:hypothetical protein
MENPIHEHERKGEKKGRTNPYVIYMTRWTNPYDIYIWQERKKPMTHN